MDELLEKRDQVAKQMKEVSSENEKKILYEEFQRISASLRYIPL